MGLTTSVRNPARPASLNDFVDEFECMTKERSELTLRLSQVLDENQSLRAQLSSRMESLLAARERLIREEFERKYQDLLVEVRRERTRHGQLVEKMKKQISSCICSVK
jgi:hypothetical protein